MGQTVISLSLTTWIHLGRGMTRIVLGHNLGREIAGPVEALARAAKLPMAGDPKPCEQCERITPYADLWRSLTAPSRAYCQECLGKAVRR